MSCPPCQRRLALRQEQDGRGEAVDGSVDVAGQLEEAQERAHAELAQRHLQRPERDHHQGAEHREDGEAAL